jgi:hypothetical protein
MSNWMQHLSNLYYRPIRKIVFDLVKNNYNYDKILESVSKSIQNNEDYENFGKMLLAIYEAGYFRAIDDHKSELAKLGLKINLKQVEEPKKDSPIF